MSLREMKGEFTGAGSLNIKMEEKNMSRITGRTENRKQISMMNMCSHMFIQVRLKSGFLRM